mmetsp:Transcript_26259/g.75821  ORF Transcript_26259/g.75821 Transcript_26259/m.75821 type:complete len:777 (+) Transcript_26259:84-2414(+)
MMRARSRHGGCVATVSLLSYLASSTSVSCWLASGFVVLPPSPSLPSADDTCTAFGPSCPSAHCALRRGSRHSRSGDAGCLLQLSGMASSAPSLATASALTSSSACSSHDAIQLEETETEAILDDGSTLVYLVRSRIDQNENGDGMDRLAPICQGVLIQPPSSDAMSQESNMEAWISPLSAASATSDSTKEQINVFKMATAKVIDSLLLQRLLLERSEDGTENADDTSINTDAMAGLILGVDGDNDANDHVLSQYRETILSRGFVPAAGNGAEIDEGRIVFRLDYGRLVQSYSELAIENRGTSLGMEALEILGLMSARRKPYHFAPDPIAASGDASGSLSTRNIVAPQRGLFPKETIDQVKDTMATIETNGWLATNLDSVDNLPSLHLNLVSGGEPIFPMMDENVAYDADNEDDRAITFEGSIGRLWRLVKPHLEDKLLPRVCSAMGSSMVQISDVFIRRYGEDVQPDHAAATRYGISAHFDVTASTTSVVALDDVAAEGKSGLYTTEISDFCTNHAALRRYFPLSAGDAVIHTWDVLHGVEIDPGQQRTSLIVWFEDRGKDADDHNLAYPPWLTNPSVDDDVGQFVLATATSGSVDQSLLSRGDDAFDEFHPLNLYIRSAALGNAFALTSLGSLCNEGSLPSEFIAKSKQMLQGLRGLGKDDEGKVVTKGVDAKELAIELWHEAAIRGNPLAQTSLADEYMGQSMELMSTTSGNNHERANELRLKATTLFAIAGQQGYNDALQALPRVLNVESSTHEIAEDFYNSPVFQTAQAVLV